MEYKNEPNPFPEGYKNRLITIEQKKDKNKLQILFYVPSDYSFRKKYGLGYLSSLLGHEGQNTLTDYLIQKNYITSLSTGSVGCQDYYSALSLKMKLTDLGLKNLENIIEAVGQTIQNLKTQGVQQWYYEEIKKMLELNYRI